MEFDQTNPTKSDSSQHLFCGDGKLHTVCRGTLHRTVTYHIKIRALISTQFCHSPVWTRSPLAAHLLTFEENAIQLKSCTYIRGVQHCQAPADSVNPVQMPWLHTVHHMYYMQRVPMWKVPVHIYCSPANSGDPQEEWRRSFFLLQEQKEHLSQIEAIHTTQYSPCDMTSHTPHKEGCCQRQPPPRSWYQLHYSVPGYIPTSNTYKYVTLWVEPALFAQMKKEYSTYV